MDFSFYFLSNSAKCFPHFILIILPHLINLTWMIYNITTTLFSFLQFFSTNHLAWIFSNKFPISFHIIRGLVILSNSCLRFKSYKYTWLFLAYLFHWLHHFFDIDHEKGYFSLRYYKHIHLTSDIKLLNNKKQFLYLKISQQRNE